MAYSSFEDLEVWKRACRLAVEICRALGACKNYGLRDQMQRAAVSVPSNIAEGYERDSIPDFIRFLRIAKGSAAELRTQLYITAKLELLPQDILTAFIAETRELGSMLQGLIRSRSQSLNLKP